MQTPLAPRRTLFPSLMNFTEWYEVSSKTMTLEKCVEKNKWFHIIAKGTCIPSLSKLSWKWYFYLLLPRQNCLFSEIIFPFWNYFFPTKHLFSRKIGGKLLIWKEVYIFFLRNGLLYNTMGFTIWTSDRCGKIALLANFRTLYE